MIDLTAAELAPSLAPAFKNNNIYQGQATISGNWTPGYQEAVTVVTLPFKTDMLTAEFNGPADSTGGDPRPATGWFKDGQVYVPGNNAGAGYTNYPVPFRLTAVVSGSTIRIVASSVSQISPTLALTATKFSYRIVDYSVL